MLEIQSSLKVSILAVGGVTRKLLGYKEVEWREVLTHKDLALNIEIPYIKDSSLSIGVLKLEISLLAHKYDMVFMNDLQLQNHIQKEKEIKALRIKRFYEYSHHWWEDYKSLYHQFSKRAVKIFAEDETGTLRPVFTFLKALRSRALTTPGKAARFVSLIPLENNREIRNPRIWRKPQIFLSEKKGNSFDHALLLCSLFLGFKKNAYVCLGSSSDGAHAWLLTITEIKGKKKKFHFWESLTGRQYSIDDPRVAYLYRRIGCVFNDHSFYANAQEDDRVNKTEMDISDPRLWKPMENLQEFRLPESVFELSLGFEADFNEIQVKEKELEQRLITALKHFRKMTNRSFEFDEELSFLFSEVLEGFEDAAMKGKKVDEKLVKEVLEGHVKDGTQFHCLPVQFQEFHPQRIFETFQKSATGDSILSCKSDKASYAVRAKVVPYPEGFKVVWVIIAVHYPSP